MEEIESLNKKRKTDLITIFGYVMFITYPLIFHDFYYDIVTCKFVFFIVVTIVFLVLILIFNKDKKTDENDRISTEERMILVLVLINSISFFLSDYKYEALIGADGRNNGMLTIIAYLVICLCILGSKVNKEKILFAVIIGSVPVSIFGIFNFINIDLLGFYNDLSMQYKQFYMSTLGHVNVYSSYFAITIPVVLAYYFRAEKLGFKIAYYMISVVNIAALICSGCESTVLILFIAVLCNIIREKKLNISKWYILMLAVLIINKILVNFNESQNEKRILSKFMEILSYEKVIFSLVFIFAIFILIDLIRKSEVKSKIIKIIVIISFIAGILIYISMFIYFTFIDENRNLGEWSSLLRFNDEFGSYRGYIWRIVIEEFNDLSMLKKIFGIGPDVLYPLVYEKYGNEMYKVTNAYYDNAHNEILQYLITTGIAGVVTYILFLATKVKRFISLKGQSEFNKILMCSCICYFFQSFVNINQVVTTPLFVIMLCMLNSKEV